MDKEKVVLAVLDKLKTDRLFVRLEEEKNPEQSVAIFKDFLSEFKLQKTSEIQEVLAHLKLKGLFNTLFDQDGMEKEWQRFKNEAGLKGFVFRI